MEYKNLTDLINEMHSEDCFKDYNDYCRLFDLSAELEHEYNTLQDKIENGTLVEIPYKIGDTAEAEVKMKEMRDEA